MATVVLGPADKPPVGHLAGEIMLYHKLKAIFAPPSVFEQLILESQALELMKDLEFLLYAGGPLSENTGGILSKMTNVCQFYGSTETNGIPTLLAQREDWAYLEFHPFAGVEMRPSDDDAFELILHNDPQARESRSFSCNYPNIEEYQSRDLFKPHPTKPHLWRFHGRKDDIIVLSNSAKINPVPSEAIITGHPLVSAALVVGFGRLQPALLLEPMPEVELAISALIDEIWPTIQYANQQARDYGRIVRAMIVVANVNKSFERAGKGTVMRKMTTEKFASEIEALYSDLDQPLGKSSIVLTRPKELSQVKHFVSACVNETFKVPELGEREDIFVRGLDSIGSIAITRSIKAGFPMSDKSWLSVQTLYAHPSIEKLAEVVYHKLNLESSTASQANGIETPRIAEISASVAKYTKTLTPKLNVLLTGSTGSLGTRILSNLITSPRIGQITCLNRSSNASARQQKTFMALDFQHELSEVSFITASLSSTRLGISDESYDALVATADIIIHNAWPVNFTHTFATFEPHLIGIRNLIDFNLQSKKNPRIIFVSSASSVSNYHHVDRSASAVPEHLVTNHVAPAHMGYAESKYVAECILGEAARQCDVLVSILRVGQIAGVVSGPGIWSKNEWIYAMLKSSKTLRCLPTDLEHVDWVPVDTVAKFVMDIVASQKDVGAKLDVMNVVNPHPVPWSQFVPAILARLGQEEVKAVPMSEWVNRLERAERESDVQNKKVLDELPALKIIDFFRMVAQPPSIRLATDMARARSKTLSNLEPVSEAWMDIWLERWGL
ncbi:uncharacterized protein KY384_001329 [Bacidia gigantensis]|uniref:uncharacterized protein n=1 Tax=Bacidia gigantensis TaxID=2732470 RepID=UPI001D04AC9C|nr:uncharacterized protein KY384_001329 [Bacidia gigantensis]KAG8533589.1 hypothetical protein KY384_001329 [Bacidia gigantensis]